MYISNRFWTYIYPYLKYLYISSEMKLKFYHADLIVTENFPDKE